MNAEDTNLGEAISRMVVGKLDAAFVEKEVDARISKLVIEAVDKALRTYSETGKLIEKVVEDALRVDRIDLPAYGHVVAQMVKAEIEGKVAELIAGRLAADVDELLGLAPKEVRLSTIAADMLEEHKSAGAYGELITVIVEHTDYRSTLIYLDDQQVFGQREKYRCRYHLHLIESGEIIGARIADHDLKKLEHIGRFYGFEQKLRAYVACGTKIIVDEDAVVTGVGD